jgi:hypothetical protein
LETTRVIDNISDKDKLKNDYVIINQLLKKKFDIFLSLEKNENIKKLLDKCKTNQCPDFFNEKFSNNLDEIKIKNCISDIAIKHLGTDGEFGMENFKNESRNFFDKVRIYILKNYHHYCFLKNSS